MWRRVLRWTAGVIAALAVAAGALYAFGTMETPAPEVREAFAAEVAAGRAEAVPDAFRIPVPGCRCHHPDPVVQMQHSVRPIRECMECHG